MDPVSIGAIIQAGVKAMAAEFGKTLAQEFSRYVFGTLATKKDIEQAVLQLQAFVDQRIDELEDDLQNAGLLAAVTHLRQFETTREIDSLNQANGALVSSNSLFQTRSKGQVGFVRQHFIVFIKLMNTDIAIWLYKATLAETADQEEAINGGHRALLRDKCVRYAEMIDNVLLDIEDFQMETLTPLQFEQTDSTPPYDPPGPRPPRETEYSASYSILGKRYPGGSVSRQFSRWNDSRVGNDAKNSWNSDAARIKEEEQWRETNVLSPARNYSACLKKLAISIDTASLEP